MFNITNCFSNSLLEIVTLQELTKERKLQKIAKLVRVLFESIA